MNKVNLAIDEDILEAVNEADRIYIIACGTSYHAGLVGKQFIEKMAEIPVEVHISSEFGLQYAITFGKTVIHLHFTKW